jgi:hypothetical protein
MWEKTIQILKDSWQKVAAVVGVIGIVTAIIAFDARYAKTEDVSEIGKTVIVTAQAVKTIDVKQNVMRLNSISEQMVKMRMLMKTYPNDKEIRDDYKTLQKEKVQVQQDLDKSIK